MYKNHFKLLSLRVYVIDVYVANYIKRHSIFFQKFEMCQSNNVCQMSSLPNFLLFNASFIATTCLEHVDRS